MTDDSVRRLLAAGPSPDAPQVVGPRRMLELTRSEALRLLAGVSLGRVVFTGDALPAIRPVNHVVIDGHVVILTRPGAALGAAAGGSGVVVAYEADQIDPDTHLGWSVVVTGLARLATDPEQITRFKQVLAPWVAGQMSDAVLIGLEVVAGYRLVADGPDPPLGHSAAGG